MRSRSSANKSSKLRSSRTGTINGTSGLRTSSVRLEIEGINQDVLARVEHVCVLNFDQHERAVVTGADHDIDLLHARLPARQSLRDLARNRRACGGVVRLHQVA